MSSLVNRNVMVGDRRTSIRLEPELWDALHDICRREKRSMKDLCTLVDSTSRAGSLTSAIRVFILNYYRFADLHFRTQVRADVHPPEDLIARMAEEGVLQSPLLKAS